MPTYEYLCDSCGHEFEAFQKITDDPISDCPECGGTVRRLIGTGGGFIVKGSHSHPGGHQRNPSCDRDTPCCGREVRCDKPPCEA